MNPTPRRGWTAVGAAAAILLVGCAAVWSGPDQYRATARLFAEPEAAANAWRATNAQGAEEPGPAEALRRALISPAALHALPESAMPAASLSERDKAIRQLAARVTVSRITPHLFQIAYRDTSAERARDVLAGLTSALIETVTPPSTVETARTLGWLDRKQDAAVRLWNGFRNRYGDLLPVPWTEGGPPLERQKRVLASLETGIRDAEAILRGGRTTLGPLPDNEQADPGRRKMEAETRLELLERRRDTVRERLDHLESAVAVEPNLLAEYEEIAAIFSGLRAEYDQAFRRATRGRIFAGPDEVELPPKIQLIDPPGLPGRPMSPNRVTKTAGIALLALAAAFVVLRLPHRTAPDPVTQTGA